MTRKTATTKTTTRTKTTRKRTASPTRNDAAGLKAARLEARLAGLGSVIVAFSGGIDSAFLAVTAARVLGPRSLAVTALSPSYPDTHRRLALTVAREFSLAHEFVDTAELERPEYRANASNRCYFCKDELYARLAALARTRGFAHVADGNNADDRGDYRPGRQAAREHGVVSPLDEADLTKTDIRGLAREAGMSTWDEPASACLSSRIPYGAEVTDEKLRRIERAEEVVRAQGFRIFRVRHHDDTARIEVARDEMARALEPAVNTAIVTGLRTLGYRYVALDLQGYRLGSLNEALRLRPVS
ncbi:MAG: ATP-dependent sacrificial sulfur transferase LarE [Acidobacteria bacterium]|nr:ATP-dependent sacrificial sulfur transferase LarE [Acidobacteriota bacterium]